MGTFDLISARMVSISLLTIAFLGISSFASANATDTSNASDETIPPSAPLAAQARAQLVPRTLDPPAPGETQAWFFPSDNDATATVMYLLNTDTVAHIVALRGYSQKGVLVYSLNINIDATSMLRLASDSIATPPPSWSAGSCTSCKDPVIVNFTDFTYFASISLPKGVKVDGYVIFNPGTGTVDPRADQGAIPLWFMTSPFYLP